MDRWRNHFGFCLRIVKWNLAVSVCWQLITMMWICPGGRALSVTAGSSREPSEASSSTTWSRTNCLTLCMASFRSTASILWRVMSLSRSLPNQYHSQNHTVEKSEFIIFFWLCVVDKVDHTYWTILLYIYYDIVLTVHQKRKKCKKRKEKQLNTNVHKQLNIADREAV